MKEARIFIITTLQLALLVALQGAELVQPEDTLSKLINPSFEQALEGWKINSKGNSEDFIVKEGAHSGQCALRVKVKSNTQYWNATLDIEQTMTGLQPNTWYELSLWAKSKNATGFFFGARGPDWYSDTLPLNCPKWQRFTVKFKTKGDEKSVMIFLKTFQKADEVMIDDLTVVAVGNQPNLFITRFPATIQSQLAHLDRVKTYAMTAGLADNAYVQMGLSIASRYLSRVQSPDIQKYQTDDWTALQLREIAWVLEETERLIRRPLPDVPPIPYDHPKIDRGVFVAGSPPAPIFYGGYMGFRGDDEIPSFSKLGVSSIVIERGPNSLGPDGNGKWSLEAVQKGFEQAQQANIKVDMLLSPHYFPDWALKQAPEMAFAATGFLKYNVDHPVARRAIEQWLRVASLGLKDKPALMSFNLANEPEYSHSGKDSFSKPLWAAYLQKRHGSIEVLNKCYEKTYANFEAVAVPERGVMNTTARRAYYDWVNFNAQHFGEWFRWMNRVVKEGAPEIFTQIKLSIHPLDPYALGLGIDHEELSHSVDLAGTDLGSDGRSHQLLYSYNWQRNELTNDLLRSFRQQPVCNSENHTINDGEQHSVSPDFLRASMWQGTLHGLGQTACWEFGDHLQGEMGGIKLRPACVFGAGRAWLDARRCASQVAAVVRAKSQVAILYTRNSLFWKKEAYANCVTDSYTALTFLGVPVTFVTERQLADGSAPPVQAIILPQSTHVTDATVVALSKFAGAGGRLVALGEGNLSYDEYDRQRNLTPGLVLTPLPATEDERVLFSQFAALPGVIDSRWKMLDAESGERVFGVEYRIISDQGRTYLSALNQLRNERFVKLSGVPPTPMRDLLSGELLTGARISLKPMVPVMVDLGF